ncbi:MAG: hypothetical protein M1511_16700 [Deltaproteobacteria bacterium]|nr:hypothetical protein [Deltaproteobacteria bacterium]
MTDATDIQHKWLEERFNHVNTVLAHIRESVDHLRLTQAAFMNRCSTEMTDLIDRVRETERKQAIQAGHEENRKHAQATLNLRWQMIIAFGTAISGIAAFIGYFMGKGQ